MKSCSKCERHLASECYRARRKGKDYQSAVCIDCRRAQSAALQLKYHYANPAKAKAKRSAYRAANREKEKKYAQERGKLLAQRDVATIPTPETKFCRKCSLTKKGSEFGTKLSALSGLRSHCLACERAVAYRRYLEDPRRAALQSCAYYHANKDVCRSRNTKWCRDNRERRDAIRIEYLAQNASRLREYRRQRHLETRSIQNAKSKEWRRKNPEKVREFTHARRARIAGQGGRYTAKDIERINAAQRGKCAVCAMKLGRNFHRDHIMPISRGGSNAARNIQLTCDPCNSAKHAKDPITFMQERGFLL